MAETPPKSTRLRTKKRKVVPTILCGFILAFLEMGMPMIGITVNLWLGGIVLAAAFALFAWGLWNLETNHQFGRTARAVTLIVVGMIYFELMGFQIHAQYKKDHPQVSPVPQSPPTPTQQPPPPDCKGNTGDAKASDGSIANTGNCVDDLNVNAKPKGGSGTK
jgi:hypothetical protein